MRSQIYDAAKANGSSAMVKGGCSTSRWNILRICISLSKTIKDLGMGITITQPGAIDVKET
jgi:hypothetical protein